MFVNTKKTIKIVSDNGTVFSAKAGWIGEVPEWVQEHWYFKSLCKDGTVTAIVSTKDKAVQAAVEQKPNSVDTGGGNSELDALRARAAELKIPRYTRLGKEKLTNAIAEAEAKLKPADTSEQKPDDDGEDNTPGEQE
jgi:hypothetical protein